MSRITAGTTISWRHTVVFMATYYREGVLRKLLSTLPILSLSMAAIFPSAHADPPPSGQAISFLEPMVVCKTHGELKELVEALRLSVEAYDSKLKQLGVDRSECDVNTVSEVVVGECEDVGEIDFNHVLRRLWLVHFTNAAKDGWGLYEEAVAELDVPI